MISRATPRFWNLFRALPSDVRVLAVRAYRLWLSNPSHPSLRFRRLQGVDLYTVRIGDHYRALAQMRDQGHDQRTIIWTWIGTHADYDRLVGS